MTQQHTERMVTGFEPLSPAHQGPAGGIETPNQPRGSEQTMSEQTRKMCEEQAQSVRESLDELWGRIDSTDNWRHAGDSEDVYEELGEYPLEVVWEKGEPFAVVLGTGGPHVEIRGGTRHDGSGYTLHVYWSGEHATARGEGITRTGAYFRELVEETE